MPAQVDYSPSDHKATLTFSAALAADKLFRLEVGEQTESIEISQVAVGEIVIEESPLSAPEIHPFNITFNPTYSHRGQHSSMMRHPFLLEQAVLVRQLHWSLILTMTAFQKL